MMTRALEYQEDHSPPPEAQGRGRRSSDEGIGGVMSGIGGRARRVSILRGGMEEAMTRARGGRIGPGRVERVGARRASLAGLSPLGEEGGGEEERPRWR